MAKIVVEREGKIYDAVFMDKSITEWVELLLSGKLVEVVRCKDCRKISPSVTPVKDAVWCREFRAYMPCDGFCSYGERREGE